MCPTGRQRTARSSRPVRFPFADTIERWLKKATAGTIRILLRPDSAGNDLPETIKNILVVRQHDQLGDMLCSVPLLRALHDTFPAAEITLVAGPVNSEIMQNHPYVTRVITYDKRPLRFPSAVRHFYRALRDRTYDLAIVPGTVSISATSNILAYASGARIRVGSVGPGHSENGTEALFTHTTTLGWDDDPHRHQTLRNLDVAWSLPLTTPSLELTIGLEQKEIEAARKFVAPLRAQCKILVGFHPGAGKLPNRWPAERFAEVADFLSGRFGVGVLVTAGPMDDEPVEKMTKALQCSPTIVRGKSIREVASIISQLNLYVTNDTGVMHVSAGVGTPTLSLFGPTDPLQWAPIGEQHRYLVGSNGNMGNITIEKVVGAVREMLSLK
jgi:ADP-heptose:LPS heptosyltransferase